MNQEELTALIVIKIENLGIDYRTFEYDNQRAWIDTRLCIGGYNPNLATPFGPCLTSICTLTTKMIDG